MPIPDSQVIRFSPVGLSDSLDETDTFPGGMSAIQNLIPDPSTKNLWACRPASVSLTGTSTSSFVVYERFGTLLYGMRQSLTFPGYDEPFCYDLVANSFITVSNVTGSNIPLSQPTTGDWTRPTIDIVGVNVIVTHPGFDGVTNFFGWFDTSTPSTPVWNAGNLAGSDSIEALGSIVGGTGYTNGVYSGVSFTCHSVLTFGAITGGTGYVNGSYFNVPLTGGSGSHALANIQVAGGTVTTCVLVRGGISYLVGDTLSASNSDLGGSGSGFSVPVQSISAGSGAVGIVTVSGGSVTAIYLTSRGTEYNTTDDITAPNSSLGGTGSGFYVPVALIFSGAIVLTTVPTWVRQYGQRAHFGVNPVSGQPSVPFTDILFLNVSNANQVLTFGDNVKLTTAHGLPLNNQLGGIVQSLLVFKGADNIYQVTGDYALNTLAINTLNCATGTLAPGSLCSTPKGVAFLAPDGYRLIDFDAHVSDPIGSAGSGITVPLVNTLHPTRVVAACNASVLRVTVQPGNLLGTPFQEYWFDIPRQVWSGPHTFPATVIVAYDSQFVLTPQAVSTKLFSSQTAPSITSSFSENGSVIQFLYQTVMLADPVQFAEMSLSDLTVNMALDAAQVSINIAVLDENGAVYKSVVYFTSGSATLWDVAIWDVDVWDGAGSSALRPRYAAFTAPVVYRRISVQVSGSCASGFKIGDCFLRRQVLGYPQPVL